MHLIRLRRRPLVSALSFDYDRETSNSQRCPSGDTHNTDASCPQDTTHGELTAYLYNIVNNRILSIYNFIKFLITYHQSIERHYRTCYISAILMAENGKQTRGRPESTNKTFMAFGGNGSLSIASHRTGATHHRSRRPVSDHRVLSSDTERRKRHGIRESAIGPVLRRDLVPGRRVLMMCAVK